MLRWFQIEQKGGYQNVLYILNNHVCIPGLQLGFQKVPIIARQVEMLMSSMSYAIRLITRLSRHSIS